jgi:hypothetical protein
MISPSGAQISRRRCFNPYFVQGQVIFPRWPSWANLGKARKRFFFEKKKQKTFALAGVGTDDGKPNCRRAPMRHSG